MSPQVSRFKISRLQIFWFEISLIFMLFSGKKFIAFFLKIGSNFFILTIEFSRSSPTSLLRDMCMHKLTFIEILRTKTSLT